MACNTLIAEVIIKMATVTERIVQPLGGAHFPMSYAIVGSVIPGELRRYPVKIVNHHDLTSVIKHRIKPVDPVKQFPSMGDDNSKGHPMMEKLKQMLMKSGQPQMQPGFERVREDLSWRGVSGFHPYTPPNSGAHFAV